MDVLYGFWKKIFGLINVLHSHSILHDAFGGFYKYHSLDREYSFVLPENLTTNVMKRNPLSGQIIGIIYCLSQNIII